MTNITIYFTTIGKGIAIIKIKEISLCRNRVNQISFYTEITARKLLVHSGNQINFTISCRVNKPYRNGEMNCITS